MYDKYLTERLSLRILSQSDARIVADFYARNFDDFKLYEPLPNNNITKISSQRQLLKVEREQLTQGNRVRFFVFEKDRPLKVVGTVSFRDIRYAYSNSAVLGYKIDSEYRNMGYATEAIDAGLRIIKSELEVRRVEATVLPDNYASIRVLEKLGFEQEGLHREKIWIEGEWRDHYLYAKLMP